MKKYFLLLVAVLLVFTANSQTEKTKNSYDTINFEDIGCLKYKYKTISIEDEKNKSLFFNDTEDNNFTNFTSLIIKSIENYGLIVFRDSDFQQLITFNEVLELMGERTDTLFTYDEFGEEEKTIDKTTYKLQDIVAFEIKELCIYDKSGGLIQSRVEAVCPIRKVIREDNEAIYLKQTFWIYFDEFSYVLKKYNIFENETFFDFFYNKKYEAKLDREFFVNTQKYEQNYDHIFKYPEQKNVCPVSQPNIIYTKDIMYAEYKYRILDTLETENRPLFFPKSNDENSHFKSLIEILMSAIKERGLMAYAPSIGFTDGINIFENTTTLNELQERLGKEIEEMEVWDEEHFDIYGEHLKVIIQNPCDLDAVNQYAIQELWLYNYNSEVIDVKTVAIAPIRLFYRDEDIEQEDVRRIIPFWIYYPEFKHIASEYNVSKTDCQTNKTFDKILFNQEYKSDNYVYRIREVYTSDTTIFDTIPCIVNLEENKIFYENIGIVFSEKEVVVNKKKQKKVKYTKTVYTKIEKNNENKAIFFPEEPSYGYKSLIDHIMYNSKNNNLTLYNSEKLEQQIKIEEAKELLGEGKEMFIDLEDYGNET